MNRELYKKGDLLVLVDPHPESEVEYLCLALEDEREAGVRFRALKYWRHLNRWTVGSWTIASIAWEKVG